jgi:N-acetylmuramoyl-L-alanine amidase
MEVMKDFLTIDPYTRSGYKRTTTLAVVLHWVAGQPKQTAKGIRDYFESLKGGPKFASIQYVVGWQGEILQLMEENERAYHVGHAGKKDPVSGKFYTDEARALFGMYATNPDFSPSYCTIGIEMCQEHSDGRFSKDTLAATLKLCTDIFKRYPHFNPYVNLTTHEKITGWKPCPLWFHSHPEDFVDFQRGLAMGLQ